jgi:hypothetical protein
MQCPILIPSRLIRVFEAQCDPEPGPQRAVWDVVVGTIPWFARMAFGAPARPEKTGKGEFSFQNSNVSEMFGSFGISIQRS